MNGIKQPLLPVKRFPVLSSGKPARLAVALAVAFATISLAGTGAPASAAPLFDKTISATIPVPPPCLLSQWTFTINNLNNAQQAPSSIAVSWSSPPNGANFW